MTYHIYTAAVLPDLSQETRNRGQADFLSLMGAREKKTFLTLLTRS